MSEDKANNQDQTTDGPGDYIEDRQVSDDGHDPLPPYSPREPEDVVQVTYQSNPNGSLIGVESMLVFDSNYSGLSNDTPSNPTETSIAVPVLQTRPASTLPPVAEESSFTVGSGYTTERDRLDDEGVASQTNVNSNSLRDFNYLNQTSYEPEPQQFYDHISANAIYSTVNKRPRNKVSTFGYVETTNDQTVEAEKSSQHILDGNLNAQEDQASSYAAFETSTLQTKQTAFSGLREEREYPSKENVQEDLIQDLVDGEDFNEEINNIFSRHKQGAAESGSFKNNFRKKLGISVSTNENHLTAHRQKLLESQEADNEDPTDGEPGDLPKFKRTHSVSFNVNSSRSGRHSVDIRNLPSYLTVKRASIVDVAKGAMSSLIHSFGSGASSKRSQHDSSSDEEPIFEEPIAPTLSLGQRVALVGKDGAEFGTVGWIGQLPDVDDDWIVGVVFDNMIGNCDGAHNGIRYFYARENYAMFVPLSSLIKTDNYIGRPETGTMLSRMSVSLKPGQLISIQRSSIRLQHCFLNAPHQRVGHDVRAVSNRLHCQCHNCGPCAHLTKQGRLSSIPSFGAHHAPNKKNSLAHAAVELLAHHHHHYHEEEHKEEEYQFGDNAAHACNFVRYSCCQQTGSRGHDFSADCEMVRPELLDNLIHAPRMPHRKSRPKRKHQPGKQQEMIEPNLDTQSKMNSLEAGTTMTSWGESEINHYSESSCSSCSSRSSSKNSTYLYDSNIHYTVESASQYGSSYRPDSNVYNTIDTQMSIMDQKRFISQNDSSTFVRSRPSDISDEYDESRSSLGSKIRRCFNCGIGRKDRRRKPKKRKLSARDRFIEYRRRQSTFVPSTLAKPQEDFASHGMSFPVLNQTMFDSNSDYSSYSNSSRSSSPKQQVNENLTGIDLTIVPHQESMTLETGAPPSSQQLKSSHTSHQNQFTPSFIYDDHLGSDDQESYKKIGFSRDSALTDLGYFDSLTSHSNDTIKQIVDQSINEEVSPPVISNGSPPAVSPISSNNYSVQSEQIAVSSPTVSTVDHDDECVCRAIGCLDLDNDPEPSP